MSLYRRALRFATDAHEGQVRKYTATPYIEHPIEVAEIIEKFCTRNQLDSECDVEVMKAVALLHDTVEDTEINFRDISLAFGEDICEHVFWLTDTVDARMGGNRAIRKRLAAKRLGRAPIMARMVKVADLISNTKSIVEHDPNFAVTYLREKAFTLDCMALRVPSSNTAMRELLREAYSQILVDQ